MAEMELLNSHSSGDDAFGSNGQRLWTLKNANWSANAEGPILWKKEMEPT